MMDDISKLKFRLIDSSTEDPNYPLNGLMNGVKSNGWASVRFCSYPQEITLQFFQPVSLKQINIIANEKKIPSIIGFSSFLPTNNDDYYLNYKQVEFDNIGYIKMSTNLRTNFKARELRKIFIDKKVLYFKIQLHKNYNNKFNVFNQVGLMSIEFFGKKIPIGPEKKNYLNEALIPMIVSDEDLDSFSSEKLRILKTKMEEAILKEDFDQCSLIKKNIETVRSIGRKIFELENKKKIHINNEDFENAKIAKIQIEKLKMTLKMLDKQPLKIPVLQEEVKNPTLNENETEIVNDHTQSLNDNENSQIDKKKNKFTNVNISANFDSFASLGDIPRLNASKSQNRINEDEFAIYDEIILPPVLRKINNQTLLQLEESGIAYKGELEDLDPKVIKKYELLIKFIGEEGLKKLFSKQILWKEEGFDEFLVKINAIFSGQTPADEINQIISMIMRLIIIFIEEKHPSIIVKTLQILHALLECIKIQGSKIKLNYDFNLTDRIIIKLKEKLGDVSTKVRSKAVDIYCYMLQQDFCDYNNLISELIEEEMKHVDSKYIPKSNKLILGKLTIFNRVLDDLQNAIQSKRTDTETFPSLLLQKYLIINVSNSKSEIRKLTRIVIKKFIGSFGTKSIEKLLIHVEQRELSKLISEIPELERFFPNLNPNSSLDYNNSQANLSITSKAKNSSHRPTNRKTKRSPSSGRDKKSVKRTSLNNSIQVQKSEKCSYCHSNVKDKSELLEHLTKACLMFINCEKCEINIEIKNYTEHKLSECRNKKEFVQCKRCKEGIDQKIYDQHIKENKCNPAKNTKSSNRCPLCHKDISSDDKGFFTHLITESCPMNQRKV